MKIRSAARPGSTGGAGNTFIAVDDLENRLGSCSVEEQDMSETMPDRPCQLKITAEGEEIAMMQLLGTAFARAMVLARESGVNARIYAECGPGDKESMERLTAIGLIDNDAVIRMTRRVVAGPNVVRMPEGCVLVADDLSDMQERAYFLSRQKQLFKRENAEEWLEELDRKPMMKRLLLTSREGLAGELVCWAEQGEGVIGMVYTAPAWRRKGVAAHLVEAARQYFYQMRLSESHMDVRRSMTPVVHLAANAGYRQSAVLMRLPGSDMDAPKKGARR